MIGRKDALVLAHLLGVGAMEPYPEEPVKKARHVDAHPARNAGNADADRDQAGEEKEGSAKENKEHNNANARCPKKYSHFRFL